MEGIATVNRTPPPALAAAFRTWLRLEGLAAFAVAVAVHARTGDDWRLFAAGAGE
jgi:hypothetical protein